MGRFDYPIIDSDGHSMESNVLFDTFLDKEFRHEAPRMLADPGGANRMYFEGRYWPPYPIGEGSSAFHEEAPEHRIEALDEMGIQAQILFPSRATFFPVAPHARLAEALCRCYNDWLSDFCGYNPERLLPIGIVSVQRVDGAIREAERCITQLGMKGIVIRPNPVGGRNLDHPDYDDFYAAMCYIDAPLCVHETTGVDATAGGDRYDIRRHDHYTFNHMISHPFEQMIASMSIIAGGVLARFPKLRVGFFEAGIGWLPYWLWRLDEHYEHKVLGKQWASLTMKPSDYFKRQCSISFDPDETTAPYAIQFVGAERVLFASDYPHFDASAEAVRELFDGDSLTAAEKRKILHDNPKTFYKLDEGQA